MIHLDPMGCPALHTIEPTSPICPSHPICTMWCTGIPWDVPHSTPYIAWGDPYVPGNALQWMKVQGLLQLAASRAVMIPLTEVLETLTSRGYTPNTLPTPSPDVPSSDAIVPMEQSSDDGMSSTDGPPPPPTLFLLLIIPVNFL